MGPISKFCFSMEIDRGSVRRILGNKGASPGMEEKRWVRVCSNAT